MHGLVFCFVVQHRLEVDQCQGSQVSSLSKQLKKPVEKVGSLVVFWSFVEVKKHLFTVLVVPGMWTPKQNNQTDDHAR